MANDFPFSPYPTPTPAPSPESPRDQQPAAWPAQPALQAQEPSDVREEPFIRRASGPAPQFSLPAAPTSEADTAEPPADDEAVQKTALTIVFGVLIILALAGVGVWYFFLRDSSTPPPPPAESPQVPNLIVAALGGRIVTSDGAALTIPAGALAEDTKLEILKVESGEVTDLYKLKPTGLKFAKPVTVSIPYKESGLKKDETPYHIILEYWRDEGEKKRALKYTVDKKEKRLQAQVREF